MNGRTITFGKYKGEPIILLIATHIGYIMWCLKNVGFFSLTEKEQILYDALAISIIRDKCNMTFPIECLREFIKDKESLAKLDSPFFVRRERTYIDLSRCSERIKDVYIEYRDLLSEKDSTDNKGSSEITQKDIEFYRYLSDKVEEFLVDEEYDLLDNYDFDLFFD